MHYPETKLIGTYKGTWTLKELFEELHPEVGKHDILECRGHMGSGPGPGGSPAEEGVLIDWITPLDVIWFQVEQYILWFIVLAYQYVSINISYICVFSTNLYTLKWFYKLVVLFFHNSAYSNT